MSFFSTQNPGIGGLDELTDSEEILIQTIASLGTAGQVLATNATLDGVEWISVGSGSVSDTAYGPTWNGDTTTAPSKNAIYDKIETLVVGPASATNNNIAVYDGATGKLIKDSGATVASLAAETTTTLGALIGSAGDATPNDTDYVATALTAGGILKKITWTNTKAFLKTYFDTLYTAANNVAARIPGSTYYSVQHMQDLFHSAGWTSGGVISDAGAGVITVTGGTGLIRATDSDVATIYFTDFPASSPANVTLTDGVDNYIYVEYNAGSPRIIATTTERTDYNTNFLIGEVYREGTSVHINQTDKMAVSDHAGKIIRFNKEVMPYANASGGMIAATGTRNFSITAGAFWNGLIRFTTNAFNSATSGTFSTFYYNGTAWVETTGQTQINNTQYNNIASGLTTLSNNKYGVHWVYMSPDNHVYVVYGQGDYALTEAQDATMPSSLPGELSSHAFIVGKIIILKSATSFAQIQSAFEMGFAGSVATDHSNLANLQGGTSAQYYHLTSAEYTALSGLTASEIVVTNASGDLASAPVATYPSLAELAYVKGVTSAIQTQLDAKLATSAYDDATVAETNTGTSTAKYVSPDALAGSNLGIRYYPIALNGSTALTTSDKFYFRVPAALTGMNLVSVSATVGTGAAGSSSSGTPTFTVKNVTDNNQMLSTSLTVDVSEYTSATAATAAVINTSFDDVVTDDLIEVACTTAGTGVTYAVINLGFQLP